VLNLTRFAFTQFLGGKLRVFIGHDMKLDIVSKLEKIKVACNEIVCKNLFLYALRIYQHQVNKTSL